MTTRYLMANLQEHPSLQEKVYDHLKQAILTGEISPGQRLLETKLAESLGVSRIPVREAIRKLEREGLIVVFARRGVYASSLSARDIDEVYQVREVLEGLAARLAAERRTDGHIERLDDVLVRMRDLADRDDSAGLFVIGREFHRIVVEAADSAKLAQVMELMRGQVERIRQLRMQIAHRTHDVVREYQAIRNAIVQRDGAAAEAEMRAHVERPRLMIDAMLREVAGNGNGTVAAIAEEAAGG